VIIAPLSLPLRLTLGLAIAGQLLVLLGIVGAVGAWFFLPLGVIVILAVRGTKMRWQPLIAAPPLVALALYPPIAFDETLYHLPMVRAIARSGAIRFFSDLRWPVFPELQELLCVPLFLAFGDTATHLVAVVEIVLLAGIVFEWGGWLAAALVLGNPIVMQIGSVTYVEAALMLFVAAGFYCLDREWPVLAGFLLGTACSVKYLGLYFAAAGLLYAWRKAPRYLPGLAAGMLPMYGVITYLGGNPVFPFFGSTAWNPHLVHAGGNAWRLFRDITFARQHVNWQPPYSPLFAVSLLITLIAATRNRKAAFVAAVCVGYIAIFMFLPQDSRYLLPLLPLASVVAAKAVPRKHVAAISLIAILPGFAYAGYRIAKQGLPPMNAEQRRAYLERHIPEYRALEHRGAGVIYVCGAEQLKYYGGDDLAGEVIGPYTSMPANTRYLLISRGKCAAPPGFQRIYADSAAELWRR